MCRLFGLHAGAEPVTASFWLLDAQDSLREQSHREPDGAGIGVFDERGEPVLDKQPLADTLAELQAQVDAFDHIYNTQRPHQGLPGRVTPLLAWEATPKADAPRPKPVRPLFDRPAPRPRPAPRVPLDLPAGARVRRVTTAGTIGLDAVTYMVDVRRAFERVLVVSDGDKIIVIDTDGEVLAEHTRPSPGIRYVGNGRPRGSRPNPEKPSPKS